MTLVSLVETLQLMDHHTTQYVTSALNLGGLSRACVSRDSHVGLPSELGHSLPFRKSTLRKFQPISFSQLSDGHTALYLLRAHGEDTDSRQ